MKLSEDARRAGVSYKPAWRWWQAGQLDAYQAASGTIIVRETAPIVDTALRLADARQVAVYARVSSTHNRPHLESQAERLVACCSAKGYQVQQVVREVGSGVKGSRPTFLKVLADPAITEIVVEHKDRATRFGFRYLGTLLEQQGRWIEVVNLAENGREDLEIDLVAIVYSFCARLYGQRRAKRKTETIVKDLTGEDTTLTSVETSVEVNHATG